MSRVLCWLRRDLRLNDHAALSWATNHYQNVYLVFVFDHNILRKLPKDDRRITFIYESLIEIHTKTNKKIIIEYGDPIEIIPRIASKLKVDTVVLNQDYEPYAKTRDSIINDTLSNQRISLKSFNDLRIFDSSKVLTQTGSHYTVFTPYKNKWLSLFTKDLLAERRVDLSKIKSTRPMLGLKPEDLFQKIGLTKTNNVIKGGETESNKKLKTFLKRISQYSEERDFPSLEGTSNLSTYLRHGNISTRAVFRAVLKKNDKGHETWMSELIWREFYFMILDIYPHVVNRSFKEQYDKIQWDQSKNKIQAWQEGETGVPIIDSAMRCLNQTGMMHNRLRMIVASYLCKVLHINWQIGEEYFALKLMDFDLSANNGGWQWSSSSGCDSQPYFRIFNPYTQSKKFDHEGVFIKKFCPELKDIPSKFIHNPSTMNILEQTEYNCILGKTYPHPIVDYKEARKFTLDKLYSVVKK